MKILILEDERYFTNKIIEIVNYCLPNAEIFACSNINDVKKDNYDLGLIDIKLNDGNGLEFVRDNTEIFDSVIYITSLIENIYDAFGKNVIGFINKDTIETDLPIKLRSIVDGFVQDNKVFISTNLGLVSLNKNDIMFIQIENRKLIVYATNNVYSLKRQSIKEFYDNLNDNFVFINQSTIINLDFVSSWKKEEIEINNKYKVYASRKYLKDALAIFMKRVVL